MNEDTLFRAIGNVDDAMIEKYVPQKPPQWPRYLSCAALICLIASRSEERRVGKECRL